MSCIQWFKDTNLKANHNLICFGCIKRMVFFIVKNKLILKQITTGGGGYIPIPSCIQWFKDTNLKANHNAGYIMKVSIHAVFNGSKILIWKQITTPSLLYPPYISCIQWFKDTNLKANHNSSIKNINMINAVFNGSKILIWKQITTNLALLYPWLRCIQWFKDTNLKANHNYEQHQTNR